MKCKFCTSTKKKIKECRVKIEQIEKCIQILKENSEYEKYKKDYIKSLVCETDKNVFYDICSI